MKKKGILIVIVILIVIAILGIVIYNNINKKEYEIETIESYDYFVLKEETGYGVINKSGEKIVEAKYDKVVIPNPSKDVFVCYDEDSTKILNQNNEEILVNFQNIEPIRLKNISSDLMYEKSILTYQENDKFGLISLEGKKITNAIYDEITGLQYKEGELLIEQDENYGVIDMTGKVIIEPKYNQILVDEYYTEEQGYKNAGYIVSIVAEEGYRYGYINEQGKELLPTEYNEISRVNEIDQNDIYLIVSKNGRYGIIKNKEQLLENDYQSIVYEEQNQVYVIEKSKKYGVASKEGKIIIPVENNQIDINGQYIYTTNDDEKNVYDKYGVKVNINSNVAIITTDGEYRIKIDTTDATEYSIIDKANNILTTEKYTYLEYLRNEYFIAANSNGKLGVINVEGNEIIPIQYDAIERIENTNLLSTIDSSKNTTQIYSIGLEEVCSMEDANIKIYDEYIKIYNDEDTKYFNLDGTNITNKEAEPDNKLFAVKATNGKWGLVDRTNVTKVESIYDKATDLNEYGFAGILKDGKWGVVDSNGNIILEPIYEFKDNNEPSFIGEYYKVEYGFGEFYYTNIK